MPNRIVREVILTSERVCSLGFPDEVFYRRLMSIVDDYGRHEANPQLLRSKCYPLQTDAVRVADISRWMAACQKAGLVVLYEVLGKQYLELSNFGQQQRSPSKCPSPLSADINCNQEISNAPVFVSVGVAEVVPSAGGLFDEFYAAYPRKAKPKDARKAWDAIKPDRELLRVMLKAIADQKQTAQWQKEGGQFIPYPASWLRSESWKNEMGVNGAPSSDWTETRSGIIAKGVELGIGAWDEHAFNTATSAAESQRLSFQTYTARVLSAAGHSPRAAA